MQVKFQFFRRLEGLDHCKHDDPDHEHGRHLVGPAVEALGMPVLVLLEVMAPAREQAMVARERRQKPKLRIDPALAPVDDAGQGHERDAEREREDHRRVDDGPEETPFHQLEALGLRGAGRHLAMIDIQTGQVEHPRHPGDHRDDVSGLEPEIGIVGHRETPLSRRARRGRGLLSYILDYLFIL